MMARDASAENAMLWVQGSIPGHSGHAWGLMDLPFHGIKVCPGPGPSAINPLPGLATGPSLLYPWPCPLLCIPYMMDIGLLSTAMYLNQ